MPKVAVADVGHAIADAMRAVYHYPCQFREDPQMQTAALLAVFLFIDEMREQVYDDFKAACEEEHLDPQQVLNRLPDSMASVVQDFFTDHVAHREEEPAHPFVFHQRGFGSA